MTRARCTPGVYVQYGERGVRVGQSTCMEKRVKRSAKENEGCLGQILDVRFYPEASPRKRRALERELIDYFNTAESCNLIRA